MFVDTLTTDVPNRSDARPSPESLLKMVQENERAKLRVYIGAAAGVGKTYRMLEDAHQLRDQGIDVVLAFVETHGRSETQDLIRDIETVPLKRVEYRGNIFEEMDIDAVLERRPTVAIVDELAHSNIEGSRNAKRYEDVLELLDHGISVITALNVQHIESLNDVVVRTTGVTVRETVPDCFFGRADEVIDVDISIDTLEPGSDRERSTRSKRSSRR